MHRPHARTLLHILVCLLCLSAIAGAVPPRSAAAATSYYVATDGVDTNPGTIERPFRTVQRCASVATAGTTCLIRAGIYRETVTPANSGAPGAPIIFKPYADERVTISGADVLADWQLSAHPSGKVYQTAMPWSLNTAQRPAGNDQLFVDGVMMTEARWPNLTVAPPRAGRDQLARADEAALLTANPAASQPASASYTDADLSGFAPNAWRGAKIYLLTGALWTPITGEVTESADGSVTFTYPYEDGEFYAVTERDYYYLWGTYAALDTAQEWFREPDGTLHLWMPNGDSPAGHRIEAKRRSTLFDLRDRAYVTLEGLELFAGSIATTRSSTATVLDGVSVRYLSHFQYVPWRWYGPDEGITLYGAESEVRNSEIAYSAAGGLTLAGDRSRAINNVIHDMAYTGANTMVLATRGDQLEVRNNTLFNAGSQNVLDLRSTTRGNAQFNDVFGAARLVIDGGAVMLTRDFDGQDTEIAYNLIHDNYAPSGDLYYGSTGIYSEGSTKNYRIHHNILWNNSNGLTMHESPGDLHQNFKVYNNTIYGTIYIPNATRNPAYDMTGTVFQNNVFAKFLWGAQPNEDMLFANNLTYEQSYPNNPTANNPGFANAAAGDFTPAAGSPLIDAGSVAAPYTDGYVGEKPDIGALEHGKPAFVAGALLRERDLAGLTATCQPDPAAGKARCTLANLELGRKLPAGFQIRIGEAEPSQSCITQMNYVAITSAAVCDGIALAAEQPGGPLRVRLGEGDWVTIQSLQPVIYLPITQAAP